MFTPHLYIASFVSLMLISLAGPVEASSVIRTGDAISIEQDQKITGDFYSLANILTISGTVENDALTAGRKVTVNGDVGEDALFVGQSINIHGTVGDDLRIIGGDVTIGKEIKGDVFIIARSVTILSTARVGGDVILYTREAALAGPIEGAVMGQIQSLRIDGRVAKGVEVTTEQLLLGDRADIGGAVTYTSAKLLDRSANAVVGGEVVRRDPAETSQSSPYRAFLIAALTVLFATLLWYLLARSVVLKIIEGATAPSIRAATIGFVGFIATPIIIGLLLVSVLGTVVGVALLALYVLLSIVAIATMGAVLSTIGLKWLQKKKNLSPLIVMLGTIIICGVALVPVVGPIALFALFIVTFGAAIDMLLRFQR